MRAGEILLIALATGLVLVAALFACTDSALSRVSRVTADVLVREGRRGAKLLATVTADPVRYLNVLLLLRTLAELGAVVAVTVVVVHHAGQGFVAIGLATGAMTVVSYVVVGVAPRTLGRQRAVPLALRTAGLTIGLTQLLGPLPKLLIGVGNLVTPGKGFRDGPFGSEAELRRLVELAEQRGVVDRGERDMITGVFDLGDTIAREVMVPRPDVVFIERAKTVRQAIALALRSGFSRIPVIGDNIDDIVGVVYLKDLVRHAQNVRSDEADVGIEAVMRAPLFVPDTKPVDALLREMQAGRQHFAMVVDEYGGTAGLATIEDILEEIVGEITDEYDQERPPIEDVDAQTLRVTARLPVEDLERLADVSLEAEDVDTVGGLIAQVLGRVPIPGATVDVDGLVLTAESAAGRRNRIGTVLVRRAEGGSVRVGPPVDLAAYGADLADHQPAATADVP